ncbi:MAG: hypothetical protein LBT14_05945 [Treponema sp.]|nr:hypothetical protein [Treponema sp.]
MNESCIRLPSNAPGEAPYLPWLPEQGDPIEVLNLSVRSTNALSNAGISTVGMLLAIDRKALYDIKNLGKKSVEEILGCQEKLKDALSARTADGIAETRERIKKLTDAFQRIPSYRLDKSPHTYLCACSGVDIKNTVLEFNALLVPIKTIAEIPSIFETVSTTTKSTNHFLSILRILSVNLAAMIQDIFDNVSHDAKHKHAQLVLWQRSTGMTLQDIAGKMHVTRQRICQLERKGLDRLLKYLCNLPVDLFTFINAENNGNYIISTAEVCQYFDSFTYLDMFLYAAKVDCVGNNFRYHKYLDAFCAKDMIQALDGIESMIKSLPIIIDKEKKDAMLADISRDKNMPLKAVIIEFYHAYKLSGVVYYRGNLTLAQVYDYILDNYYPSGIKLYDDRMINCFREKVVAVFGAIELPTNNRAIDARLGDIAILCDQGAYIHPNHVTIDKALIDEVRTYIKNSPRAAFSFNELFETFNKKLRVRSNVTNKYFFQGVLKYYLSNDFFFTRGVISKEEGVDLLEDLEKFIQDREEVYKSEIFSEYSGITDIMFVMRINTNKNILSIGNGLYMHVNKLKIKPRDYQIKKILEQQTKDFPVSARKLFELLSSSFAAFLKRNNITNHEKLFGIFKYMFDKDFTFFRPYIARLGTEGISNTYIIKQHLKSYDSITIGKLITLCNEHHLRFLSPKILIKSLNDEFLRIDSKTLARITVEPDEAAIAEIARLLMEKMDSKHYVVASKITDYRLFPHIAFQWNAFILRSIVEKYIHEVIGIIDMPTTDTYAVNGIFIDSLFDVENYESLVRRILKTKHDTEPFQTINGAIDWLRQEGLFIGIPPRCLLDESILCLDRFKKIIVK